MNESRKALATAWVYLQGANMLCLKRNIKTLRKVMIGNDITLTFLDVKRAVGMTDKAIIRLRTGPAGFDITLDQGTFYEISDHVTVRFLGGLFVMQRGKKNHGQHDYEATFGFDAPKSILIHTEEMFLRMQEEKKQKKRLRSLRRRRRN